MLIKSSDRIKIRNWLPPLVAGVPFVIAIIIAIEVIPQIESDPYPFASPENAVPLFWLNVIANIIVGLTLIATLFISTQAARRGLLWLTGAELLTLGFFLWDAAQAFSRHGPAMQGVSNILLWCTAGEAVAGLLALIGAVINLRERPGQPRI